ncbi:MAG TPA: UvrD-helicase domain-containing protein [Ilumatobacter sp.]|nr:UvrD-helicase domain-containing protein [Ilumatobacter sp.]
MSTPSPAPADQVARDRITTVPGDSTGLHVNLFVEAGAGAGKTTSLVRRIVALVGSGIDITSIAAITFTEKAAAELRHRLRVELERKAIEWEGRIEGLTYDTALNQLDHAPIGTLHAFARRILNEFPIEAGLPPGFGVLDELESNLAFDERWEELLDGLLAEANPAAGALGGGATFVQLCKFRNFGLNKAFRRVANDFHDNWDLVEERVELAEPPLWELTTAVVDQLVAEVARIATTPCPPTDTQNEKLAKLAATADNLRAQNSLSARLAVLDDLIKAARAVGRSGNKGVWKKFSSEADMENLRDQGKQLDESVTEIANEAYEYRKALVGAILGGWVLKSAEGRAADGTLEFHDLLVLARRLLTHDADVRAQLHQRYQRVLLDEFQDTDPIQLAIAVRLTAAPDDPAHQHDWHDLKPLPGRLFIVGDPKQSIYRFRRADIAQYLRASEQLGSENASLTANFRSSRAVIDWVNHVFGEAITFAQDAQPGYQPLDVARRGRVDHGSVTVLGDSAHPDISGRGGADVIREREAADVVGAVQTALADGWLVGDTDDDNQPKLRPCRPGDITILLPSRTPLPALEAALREVEMPYRAENSSVVYVTNDIRHLLMALRAADDPSDQLALAAALRSPLYGCSDVHLYEWHQANGKWSIYAPPPEGFEQHPVALATAHLKSLSARAITTTPADLLAALVDERRTLDAALDDVDARDVWRRVRFVIEQARAWSDAGGHGLRRYLAWAHLQALEARAADTILPEHDHDAVRIMTVHAAKGLEFPITIVAGLSTQPKAAGGYSVVWPDDTWTLASLHDNVFDQFQPVDEQMSDAERRRLLYVACTRAVDHLVVSLHRKPRNVSDRQKMTSAELLYDVGAADKALTRQLGEDSHRFVPTRSGTPHLEWNDVPVWSDERARVFTHAGRRTTVSATLLAATAHSPHRADHIDLVDEVDPGLDKEPVDLDLPPWQRGRYGTAVGRAVHAVLQYADLATGTDIDEHAAAQCAAEGILGMDDTVANLAKSAITAPIVRQAIAGAHHRELFVAAPIGGRVLEGYIDLFVDTPEGGIIVDYKTDQWPDDGERTARIQRYRLQLAAYAIALEQILGTAPAQGILVRCRPNGPAEQIDIPHWNEALDEARAAASVFV